MTGCAIVTGASRGFGRGIAEALAARGRPVVTASRTTGTDVTDPAAVDALVEGALERYGAVDVLVNNAGAPALLRELDGVAVHCLCPSLTPDGGVGRAAAAVFAAEEGIDVEDWLARRRPHRLTAAAVGDAVVELAGRDGGDAAWHLDADGLAEWDLFAATPVAAREG